MGAPPLEDDPEVGKGIVLKAGVVDKQVEHGRDHVGEGHFFPDHGFQDRWGVEFADDHVGAAHPGNGPGGPGIGQMEQGGHVDPDIRILKVQFGDGAQGMEGAVPVG